MSVSPASGSAPADLTVSVDTTGLSAGTYTGSIQVTAAGATGSPQTVAVTLTVDPPPPPPTPPALSTSPASLAFSAVAGGAAPAGAAGDRVQHGRRHALLHGLRRPAVAQRLARDRHGPGDAVGQRGAGGASVPGPTTAR